MVSAVVSTQSIRLSSVVTDVPGQVSLSGQLDHHVILCIPGSGSQVRSMAHVLLFWTVPPSISQSSRVAAATQAFPMPIRQQKGTLGTGSRLPHLLWTPSRSFCSDLSTLVCTLRSARQLARVPPPRPHFSSIFSTVSRCFTPALPIDFWQSFSPVS